MSDVDESFEDWAEAHGLPSHGASTPHAFVPDEVAPLACRTCGRLEWRHIPAPVRETP